jgi:hypothetical protein
MKMKIGKFSVKTEVLFGVFTALSIALAPVAISQTTGATYLAETASVVGACGKLFDVDSNAAGMTAAERAAIIQKNLDYAVIHAKNRTPAAVRVLVVNRNPVVTVDGFHIATADGNSAARNRMSQMELAQKWADSIKFCLADAAAMDKYLAMLTGNYAAAAPAPRSESIAFIPGGAFMPVKLATPVCSETAQIGDKVAVVLSNDVPLQTSQSATQYEAYLPAGSVAHGHIVDASNSYTKKALSFRFDEIRLPDGEVVPINGHIFGGIGTWVVFNPQPHVAEYGSAGPVPASHRVASKGSICGGWRGNPQGAGLDIPFKKLTLTRKSNVAIAAGEPMMLQFGSSSAIAVCNNCGSGAAGQSVAQGGSNMGGSNAATNPLAGGSGAM